jgi:hypothetical protein
VCTHAEKELTENFETKRKKMKGKISISLMRIDIGRYTIICDTEQEKEDFVSLFKMRIDLMIPVHQSFR